MPDDSMYDANESVARIGRYIRSGIIPAPGVASLNVQAMSAHGLAPYPSIGERLRDSWWQKFPLMPALVSSFVQIATSREWTVTGTPRLAGKAVERLNNAVYVDDNGMLHEGWLQFTARRVVDWLMLGVNGMIVPSDSALIQYVDPLDVQHKPSVERPKVLKTKSVPEWKDFYYADEWWSTQQVFFNFYLPYGGYGAAMAPLVPAIPLARLLYLVEQHDMSSVDGRKIKDIFIVADDTVRNSLMQALIDYVDMQTGEPDVEKHGIPIVALNKRGGISAQEKVEDHIALLGISKVPDGLDRNDLWDRAAIEFSSLTGMQVSEWYHIKSGADNRATERVNQERGRTKGPNYFNRQDQRFINNAGILGRVLFQYVEEVDIQAQKDKAEVMLRLSEAVKNLQEAVGMAISPRSLIRWLQHLGVFPTDDYLVDDILQMTEDPVKPSDMLNRPIEDVLADQEERDRAQNREREMEDAEIQAEKQRLLIEAQQSAAQPAPQEQEAARSLKRFIQEVQYARSLEPKPVPNYGDVTVNSEGHVLETRRTVYPVVHLVAQDIEAELVQEQVAVEREVHRIVEESFGL